MEGKANRLLALEGLRGVAAIVVVIFHALLIFYPAFFYGPDLYNPVHGIHFEDNTYGNPLNVFLSGAFAVAIFFVISGFVLSVGFFQTDNDSIIKKLATKRYIRLALPALVSVLIVWLILSLGLDRFMGQAEAITKSPWLIGLWNIDPNLGDAIVQGVWGVFSADSVSYNPVLWTMKYEFIGSFLVFAVCLLFRKSQYRWIIYAALALGTFNTLYLGFVLGMVLADLYASNSFPFRNTNKAALVGMLLVGLLMGGFPSGVPEGSIYATMDIGFFTAAQNQAFYMMIGAALVVISILALPVLSRAFGSRLVSSLGKYTYSLYLIHMAVLFTVCTGIFVWLYPDLGYNKAALVSIIVTLPVVGLVAYLFERFVDAPSIRVSTTFSNWFLGQPTKPLQSKAVSTSWIRRTCDNLVAGYKNRFGSK